MLFNKKSFATLLFRRRNFHSVKEARVGLVIFDSMESFNSDRSSLGRWSSAMWLRWLAGL